MFKVEKSVWNKSSISNETNVERMGRLFIFFLLLITKKRDEVVKNERELEKPGGSNRKKKTTRLIESTEC
jgi:hypothetical protein